MNPDTKRFEPLEEGATGELLRPDGSPVPKHWAIFKVGECVVVKDQTFTVAYIGEGTLLLEPAGVPLVGIFSAEVAPRVEELVKKATIIDKTKPKPELLFEGRIGPTVDEPEEGFDRDVYEAKLRAAMKKEGK
jgi:hypothetical protein